MTSEGASTEQIATTEGGMVSSHGSSTFTQGLILWVWNVISQDQKHQCLVRGSMFAGHKKIDSSAQLHYAIDSKLLL